MCDQISSRLLRWYDRHARDLPWRIGPAQRRAGILPDPYRVWLSEIMLQQTTVAAVRPYYLHFLSKWPDVAALANEQDDVVLAAWAGLGYYARARNLLKCARVVAWELEGRFPASAAQLRDLPGIGPYTAAAVAAIAFDAPETVVDGNVERVMARLFAVSMPLPQAKSTLRDHAAAQTPTLRPGDYAQAVMDLGATVCTPRSPDCDLCPLSDLCRAYSMGCAEDFPKKTPKKAKPTRFGTAFVARRSDGAFLLERRPDQGLLGGMLGWPGSAWTQDRQETSAPPLEADWVPLNRPVRHTFTHFHLELRVEVARVVQSAVPSCGEFRAAPDFERTDLPTVMRKAFDLALVHLGQT